MNLARQVAMGSQLRLRFEQEAKLLKKSVAQVARRDQRIATREKHIKELEAQLEAEINMKKATEVKNLEVTKELEDLRMRFSGLEVGNAQLSQQVSMLQAQVMGGKRIMAAFEEFKKHEDERVSARCAEMDARLDALSVDFDEELYPHMLTAIAGRRWVIGHGLRLAVMKCAESTELRQAFANVVSAGIAKGMSEGLKYGMEHGKVGLELTAVEAYDPEADNKYVAALHNLKDLSYPLALSETFRPKLFQLRFPCIGSYVTPVPLACLMPHSGFSTHRSSSWRANLWLADDAYSVIHGDYQEFDLPRSFRKGARYVDSPFIKWPWGRDWSQRLLRVSWHGPMHLAIFALEYHIPCIPVHASFLSSGRTPSFKYSVMGVIQVNSAPSGLVSIRPVPDPSIHDDPSVNSIHGSYGISFSDMSAEASSGFSTRKSVKIWPFTDVRGRIIRSRLLSLCSTVCRVPCHVETAALQIYLDLSLLWSPLSVVHPSMDSVPPRATACFRDGSALVWHQDSATDSHYYTIYWELEHSMRCGWYRLDFLLIPGYNDAVGSPLKPVRDVGGQETILTLKSLPESVEAMFIKNFHRGAPVRLYAVKPPKNQQSPSVGHSIPTAVSLDCRRFLLSWGLLFPVLQFIYVFPDFFDKVNLLLLLLSAGVTMGGGGLNFSDSAAMDVFLAVLFRR
ncbi:hypothetical protein Tco_0677886 [Tanacetum coccineum]|uniref:Uncharacterized protein n=1 Tax=Tanacetum coccineum TaxID=301880 RepID=A0ABQ4XE19_9ASTR